MLEPIEGEVFTITDYVNRKGRRRRPKSTFFQHEWPKLRHPNREKRKKKGQNRHHLLNKCRRGTSTSENLLWTDIEKHNFLHRVFKNDDPEYIIMVLDRMMSMKGYHRFRGVHVVRDRERMSA